MENENEHIPIVAIGASAGGLEAINAFFSPPATDYLNNSAFVIVLHLSPNYESLMADLLARKTKLPVQQVKHNIKVKPGNIYIIPPDKQLVLVNNLLKLSPRNKKTPIFHPINTFFISLAEQRKEKAICVILSGTGKDGSLGLQKVKENDGLVVVSDPQYSKFDGMPKSAINTGMVDFVLRPKEMMQEILNYINLDADKTIGISPKIALDKQNLTRIFDLIKGATGVDFSVYKKNTVLRRIQRRMMVNHAARLKEYTEILYKNEQEVILLKNEFLIAVSSFFRDKEAFEAIKKNVIPKIFKQIRSNKTVRIWCCACSRGQEAYSLAILINEYMLEHNLTNLVKIFATDIDKAALEQANIGEYNISVVEDIPKPILEKYFNAISENTFKIVQKIRDMVVFAYHNILKDPPFTKIDLISCRNMLIYIEAEVQKKIIALFHYSLNNNGYLFLGSSETLGSYKVAESEVIDKKNKIYLFKQSAKYLTTNLFDESFTPTNTKLNYNLSPAVSIQSSKYVEKLLNNDLMNRYIPPTIFINNKMELVHIFGDTSNYLTMPINTVRLNFEEMIEASLKIVITAGIKQCFKKQKPVFYSNVNCTIKEQPTVLDLDINPTFIENLNQTVVQVSFINVADIKAENVTTEKKISTKLELEQYSKNHISDLEFQLRENKENLQSVTEEMETTNEELQATNEELLSANEELQSTNEELQSVNEELLTVNAEHQAKISELTQLNDDIYNLLNNIDVSTIFLDKNLQIRRFTDALNLGLQVRKRDVGRPIKEINLRLKYEGFVNDIEEVLSTGKKFSKEILASNAQWIMMNILPYKTALGEISGVVITYYNVTTLKNLSQVYETTAKEYFEKDEKLNLLLEGYPDLIVEFDQQANIIALITGKNYKSPILPDGSAIEILINKNIKELDFAPLNLKEAFLSAISTTLKDEKGIKKIVKIKTKTGNYNYLDIRTEPINKKNVTCVIRDVTVLQIAQEKLDKKVAELKSANEKLQQYIDSNLELEKFAYIASHDMKEPLRGIITFSQLIKKKIEDKDYTNIDEFIDLIVSSGKRMFKLTEEMLEYSKVDTKDFNPQKIDLNELINGITADFNVSIQSRNINLKIDDMGEFYGDEMLIRETFFNLIGNAIKFNDKEKPLVQIKNQSTKLRYVYAVIDNGIGISKSYFDTIFLLFKRLHDKDTFDGTGLGLSICKKAIEKHKGNIKVKSTVNKGTTFTITIPKFNY